MSGPTPAARDKAAEVAAQIDANAYGAQQFASGDTDELRRRARYVREKRKRLDHEYKMMRAAIGRNRAEAAEAGVLLAAIAAELRERREGI